MVDRTFARAVFLDAWESLCLHAGAAKGRRCLRAGEALGAGTEAQRDALAVALVALGYPQAMMSGLRLGAALRNLRGPYAASGRYLSSSPGKGGTIWYVVGQKVEAQAAA